MRKYALLFFGVVSGGGGSEKIVRKYCEKICVVLENCNITIFQKVGVVVAAVAVTGPFS